MPTIKHVFDFNKAISEGPHTFPGGYPLYFIMNDSEPLCFKCATDNAGLIRDAIIRNARYDDWKADAVDINWEDQRCACAHCNAKIEPAYGD